jgi:hypothetical protein
VITDAPYLARYYLPRLYHEILPELLAGGVQPDEAELWALLITGAMSAGAIVIGLIYQIGQLIYLTRPRVAAAFEGGVMPGAIASGKPPSKTKASWEEKWRRCPKIIRQAAQWGLAVIYGICLMMFFGFSGSWGSWGKQIRVGSPTPWLTIESSTGREPIPAKQDSLASKPATTQKISLGWQWKIQFLSWSYVVALGGLVALALARHLEYVETGRAHSMVWHYAVWSLMLASILIFGMISGSLSQRAFWSTPLKESVQPAEAPTVNET